MADEQFTEEEVGAFAQKLDKWGSTLHDRERRMLHAILSEANEFVTEAPEVSGFSFGIADTTNIPTLDTLATGALQPVIRLQDPWRLRAFDRWDPLE